MPELDGDTIRHALTVAREHGFRTVRLKCEDMSFRAVLEADAQLVDAESEDEPQSAPAGPATKALIAPMVGYFRFASGSLKPGDAVTADSPAGTILALGITNEVSFPASGEVTEVLVSDGDAVEFGQVIARIEVKA